MLLFEHFGDGVGERGDYRPEGFPFGDDFVDFFALIHGEFAHDVDYIQNQDDYSRRIFFFETSVFFRAYS